MLMYRSRIGRQSRPVRRRSRPAGVDTCRKIDGDAAIALASSHETVIWLTAHPGDFVVEGSPIARAHPPPGDGERFTYGLQQTYTVSADRTSYQDVGFAVQQLVEVALRALSPGVNEPFTAITCIDRIGQGLARLATKKIPSALRNDADGRLRVVAPPKTFVNLVDAAFQPIVLYAERNPAIGERLLGTLALLGSVARRKADRVAIARVTEFVHASAASQLENEEHRSQLRRQREEVRQRLGVDCGQRQQQHGVFSADHA